jgi:RNA polymerase sigma-70 factor (ECF subfamily)
VTGSPEALLASFARSRSEAAFRRLHAATAPAMLGLALRLSGGDRATAEDVVQEAWMRAIDRVDRFVATGSVSRWLNGFVANCWCERRRSLLREEARDPVEFDRLACESSEPWSDRALVLRAVHALPPGFRTVLVLHDIEGFTHAEIAERLGVAEGTSKSQLARARRHLRHVLGESGARVTNQSGSDDVR